MSSNVQNTCDSLSPITWLLKILSMNCNVENKSYSRALCLTKNILTVIVIGFLDIFCLYYKIVFIYIELGPSIRLTDSIQMIYDHFQYVVDLWFIYKYGRHISIEYFKQYESIDIILGMNDYTTIKWKLRRLLCIFVSIFLTSSAFDYAAWSQGFGWKVPLVYSMAYFYLFIKIITMLDLTSHIMHIETRLTMIANLVQHYYSALPEIVQGLVGDSICNKNWLCPDASKRVQELRSCDHIIPLKILSKDDENEIQWLTRCYLLLTEQVEFINSIFGFRILLNSLSLLIDIIRYSNIAVRLIMGTQVTTYGARYLPAVSSLVRILTCVAVLVSLVVHCEKTYDQRDNIVRAIDHLLVFKNPSEKLRTTMVKFRALVLAHPISFNMAKFFRLDYNFLVSIASVTVTYTIILLQSMN